MADLSPEQERRIEVTIQKCKKCGTPAKREDWLAVISMLIPKPNEELEEYLRQARMYGIEWLIQACGALLDEYGKGNTYRDEEGVLRLTKPPGEGWLRDNVLC